jgi:hypothetical protein
MLMNDDKGSSSSSSEEPKLLSLAIIQRAASLDSAEANAAKAAAALCAAGPPPPRLERHTHHSPPGAFAMSTSGRHGIVPRSSRSRTYSDETDRSTVSSTRNDDYLVAEESQQQPPLHRVPIAELVTTQQPQVLETTNVNDDNNGRQRIWDLEIAQEVYGGQVVVTTKPPEEDGIMSPAGQRRLWLRAFFLASVMVFLLLTAVGVTRRTLEQKRKGPLKSNSNNSNSKPTVPVLSTNGSLNYTNEELLLLHETEEEEQEEHHEASFEADLIAETINGTFVSCPNQNTTTHVVEDDLRLAICDVADVWEDELEASFQNNNNNETTTTLDLTTKLWPVSCHANVTMMVCTTIRNLICTSLQTGQLPTDPFNHTMTTTTTDYSSTPRSVTNPTSSSHQGGGSSASSHSGST